MSRQTNHEHHEHPGHEEPRYRFDPDTYFDMLGTDLPAYERLQEAVAAATAGLAVSAVLDLGTGTGETLAAVLSVHPDAAAVGVDSSERMLDAARVRLNGLGADPGADLWVAELIAALPPGPTGPYDLVVSALAVHHLEDEDKAGLFRHVAEVLRPGGRFVLGDLVVPVDPADALTPVTQDHDRPATLAAQLDWLGAAGFSTAVTWSERDLVVVRADRP